MKQILDTIKGAALQVKAGWKYYLVPALALSLFSESMLGSSSLETGMDYRGLLSLGMDGKGFSLAVIYVVLVALVALALVTTAWAKYQAIFSDAATGSGLVLPRKSNFKPLVLLRLIVLDAGLYVAILIGYVIFVLAEYLVLLLPENIAAIASVVVLVVTFTLALLVAAVIVALVGLTQIEIVKSSKKIVPSIKKTWRLYLKKPVLTVVLGLVVGGFSSAITWLLATLVSVSFELIVILSANNIVYILLSLVAWAFYAVVALVSGYIMVAGLVVWKSWWSQLSVPELLPKKKVKK